MIDTTNKNILFVTHKRSQCGIYEYGGKITDVLTHSTAYHFIRAECASMDDLHQAIDTHKPALIIYNYHPSVLPWLATKLAPSFYKNNISSINIPQIGIIHEITQQISDTATGYGKKYFPGQITRLSNTLFDYYIAPDPTLLLQNPLVYKTGRLIPSYTNHFPAPEKPVIGSFGFGTPKKGFGKIVELVHKEFDEATIRFNIPSSDFADKDGKAAREIEDSCKAMLTKPGIDLVITHQFQDEKTMLDFLAQNTINVFLYEDTAGRGLSSTVDNAMAVQRPIAVSGSSMFRHILSVEPSVCVDRNSLKEIINNGFAPLQDLYDEWNAANLLWEYDRIVGSVLNRYQKPSVYKMGIVRTLQSRWNRFFSFPDKSFTWLRNSTKANDDDMRVDRSQQYSPVEIPAGSVLNRILDNTARELYRPAIEKLVKLVPVTMAKKIAEANVQQAFVFDTVMRFMPQYSDPKLLCVGSYEDTASMGLTKMGYVVEEIDPMLNYYLQEYYTKPSVKKNSYDIIFSTSVIEHDPDDESFIKCIEGLLAPGGVAVITCDYKDGWKPGDLKPEVDARFYTQDDLRSRLLNLMPSCRLVDEPQWDCEFPDFRYQDKYQYTFATFVVQKNK
ncbi:MAG: methyltransferase domain-containing protein [Chitinophagaceae bacterium]|nr:methyltransferase domain-containing protein [Chitinophagaceae bacterium]